jgi:lipoate-protein ligase A
MHTIIGAALRALGVRSPDTICAASRRAGPVLCFLHYTAGDLLLSDRKIAGSAQRKQRGAVLQHGGVLLGQSRWTPDLPGIRELTGTEISAGQLAAAIQHEFARDTGWGLTPARWTDTERARIEELSRLKYGSADWNCKR